MTQFFFSMIVAGALTATPAMAAAADQGFTRDGITYSFTSKTAGGRTVLTGHDSTGSEFRLYVRAGRVVGTYGRSEVAFAHPAARTATERLSAR